MNKRIIIVGLGGTGSSVCELLNYEVSDNVNILPLALDIDEYALSQLKGVKTFNFSSFDNLDTTLKNLQLDKVNGQEPCLINTQLNGTLASLKMSGSANAWRTKGFVSFENFLDDKANVENLENTIKEFLTTQEEFELEVYTISSICGGFGAGVLLPISYYLKNIIAKYYTQKYKSISMLACPDIYVGSMNIEQKSKAYANSYALLRELNAIYKTSFGYNKKTKENLLPPIKFSIGNKKDKQIGLLYDSENHQFANEEDLIFNKVYLFDKVVGIKSIKTHEAIMANLLHSIFIGVFDSEREGVNQENKDAVYLGIAMTEIRYPVNSISKYIISKYVYENLDKEDLHFYRKIENLINLERKALQGMSKANNIGWLYSNCILSAIEQLNYNVKEESCAILNKEEIKGINPIPVKEAASSYEGNLIDKIESKIPKIKGEKLLQPIKFFSKKSLKLEKIQSVQEEAVKLYYSLLNNYKKAVKDCIENKEEFINSLLGDSDYSITNLIKEDEYLHPSIALARIAKLYNSLYGYLSRVEVVEINNHYLKEIDEKGFLPELYSDNKFSILKSYAKLGEKRFNEVYKTNGNCIKTPLVDGAQFLLDYNLAVENINNLITDYKISIVVKCLENIMLNYLEFFKKVAEERENFFDNLRALKLENSQSDFSQINVYSAEEDKEQNFKEFVVFAQKEKTNIFENSNLFGKLVYENSLNEEGVNRRCALDIIDGVIEENLVKLKDTSFYQANFDVNIMQALCKGDKKDRIKEIVNIVSEPLKLRNRKSDEKPYTIRKILVLSTTCAKTLLNIEKETIVEGKKLQDLIEKYLFSIGNYDTEVKVIDSIGDSKMYITKEVSNVKLQYLSQVDELSDYESYFKGYLKCISNVNKLDSEMWNPHVFSIKDGVDFIPYINPKMTEKREKFISKAGLAMLILGKIRIDKNPEDEKYYFYQKEGETQGDILVQDKLIPATDPSKLFVWLRKEDSLVEKWGLEFDDYLFKSCVALPSLGFGGREEDRVLNAIMSSEIMSAFVDNVYKNIEGNDFIAKKDIFKFITAIRRNDKSPYTSGDAQRLVALVKEILITMINFRCLDPDIEGKELLKNDIVKAFYKDLTELEEGITLLE